MREQTASADKQLAAATYLTVGSPSGEPPLSSRLTPTRKPQGTVEAARLAELARAAGLGDLPDAAIEWHREALELLGSDEPTPLFADVLRWQGSVLRDRGQTSAAEPLYEQSLQVAVDLRYDSGHAHALNCLGSLAQRRGDIAAAASYFGDALLLAERCGERRLVGMLQQNLGVIADIRGNPIAALAHYRVALAAFEAANDHQQASWVLSNLGYFHAKAERFEDARGAYGKALAIARDRGDLLTEGIVEENRAELELIAGDLDAAFPSIQRALEVAEQRGDTTRRAAALKLRGAYERLSGRLTDAPNTLSHGLTLSAIAEDAFLGAELLFQFGAAIWQGGDESLGRDALRTSLDAFERIGDRQWTVRVRNWLIHGPTGRYF